MRDARERSRGAHRTRVGPGRWDGFGPRRRGTAAALAGLLLWASACGAPPDPGPAERIVLVVLDTLRADRLSVYGNPRPTSPAIDALARDGVVFERAFSHTSWTLPGFVGILSGRYPSARVFRGQLQTSLVERLREAGFATAAFTEGAYVSRRFAMDRGFDTWWEQEGPIRLEGDAVPGVRPSGGVEATFDQARRWLREHRDGRFFLLVHTYEVHGPYRRTRFARELPSGRLGETYELTDVARVRRGEIPVGETEIEYVRALYDGAVAEADRHVGELLAELEALGIAEDTVVIVTSDHGQLLSDRVPDRLSIHGKYLYDPSLRIPLVIRDPRREGLRARVPQQVRAIDVMPTVLDLAGLEPDPELDGRSLVPLMTGASSEDRPVYSELLVPSSKRLRRAAVREPGWKLILNAPGTDGDTLELYDLERDPSELENLAGSEPDVRARLYDRLTAERSERARQGRPELGRTEELDPTLRERLRSLGYEW